MMICRIVVVFAFVAALGGVCPLDVRADESDVKTQIADLTKELKVKEKKLKNLRLKNPACLFNDNSGTIRNIEKRLPKRDDKKYYACSSITYVRPTFYCSFCKSEIDDASDDYYSRNHRCDGSKVSYRLWQQAKSKVSETESINRQIDGLLEEIEELNDELKELKTAPQDVSGKESKASTKKSDRRTNAKKDEDEQLKAELEHDEEMREKKFGSTSSRRAKSTKYRVRNNARGGRVGASSAAPVFDVNRLNSELKVQSFCGIKFGEVKERINTYNGRSCPLAQKFRCFDRATCWGSETQHRVARIELKGSVDQLELDAAKKEVEDVVRILQKKFGVRFSPLHEYSSGVSCSYEDDEMKLEVSAYVSNGAARFTLSFLNKEVEQQNKQYRALLPKKELNMSQDEGADIL